MPSVYVPIDSFLEELYVLESGKTISLEPHQRRILKAAFTPNEDFELPYSSIIYSTPKKSGKTTIGGGIATWFTFCLSEPNGEVYIVANDKDQVKKRMYGRVRQAIESQPLLRSSCRKILLSGIETKDGTVIVPVANDYAGESGANPELVLVDELWAVTSEAGRRLWDELTPVMTRPNSLRVIVTYAGFENESDLLWDLYRKGLRGKPHPDFLDLVDDSGPVVWVNEEAGLFMYWDHAHRMSWYNTVRGKRVMDEARHTLRPNAYRRLWHNEWQSTETGIDMDDWDACCDDDYEIPMGSDSLVLSVAVDASYKKDLTSVSSVYKLNGRICQGPHRRWQPDPKEHFDFEATVEAYILELKQRFRRLSVRYDPYQMVRSSQVLRKAGIRCEPFDQSKPNTIKMASILIDLLRYRNLRMRPDENLRRNAQMVSIKETPDGPQIKKEKRNQKIDPMISLAIACVDVQDMPDSAQSASEGFMII